MVSSFAFLLPFFCICRWFLRETRCLPLPGVTAFPSCVVPSPLLLLSSFLLLFSSVLHDIGNGVLRVCHLRASPFGQYSEDRSVKIVRESPSPSPISMTGY